MVPSSLQKSKGPHRRDHRHPTALVPRHSRSFVAAAKPPPNSRGDADAIVAAASSSRRHDHRHPTTSVPRHSRGFVAAAKPPPNSSGNADTVAATASSSQLPRRKIIDKSKEKGLLTESSNRVDRSIDNRMVWPKWGCQIKASALVCPSTGGRTRTLKNGY